MSENNKKLIAYAVIFIVLFLSAGLVYFILYINGEYNKLNTQETISENLEEAVFEWGATPMTFLRFDEIFLLLLWV